MRTTSSTLRALLSRWGLQESGEERLRGGVLNDNHLVQFRSKRFILKIYRFRDAAQVAFEQRLLRRLAAVRFPCPRIVPTLEGKGVVPWQGKVAALYGYLPGTPQRALDHAVLRRVGVLLGTLHMTLRHEPQTVEKDRWEPADIAAFLKTEPAQIYRKRFPEAREHIPYITREFAGLHLPDGLPVGMTHQDVKPENIIVDGRCVSFIDFDNAYRGVLLYDVMTPAIWSCFRGRTFSREAFRILLRGYESVRPLTRQERAHLRDALRFRLLRESFAWAMRFHTPKAHQVHRLMFDRYRTLTNDLEL